MTPEKRIEHQILFYLNSLPNCFAFKINNGAVYDPIRKVFRKAHSRWILKGVSDVLGIYCGKMLAIEVKAKGRKGTATKDQRLFIDQIKASGGLAGIADSLDDVDNILGIKKAFPKEAY